MLFVFFLFIWEYTILKKNHKTLIQKMALQEDYRQKYRHYGELFISFSVIDLYISEVLKHRFCLTSKTNTWKLMRCKVVDLPCFFGFLTSTTFAWKKRTNFHHFIGFIECFYLNLQPILIAPFKELKRHEQLTAFVYLANINRTI